MPRTRNSSFALIALAAVCAVCLAGLALMIAESLGYSFTESPGTDPQITADAAQKALAIKQCFENPRSRFITGQVPNIGTLKAWDCNGSGKPMVEQITNPGEPTALYIHANSAVCVELYNLLGKEAITDCEPAYDPSFSEHILAEEQFKKDRN